MTVSDLLTADEKATLKRAAFGAVFLVSNADPGVLSLIKESFAASGALADAAGLVKEVLTTGGPPQLPRDDPEAVEAIVLPELRRAVEILQAKAPQEADNFRRVVLTAVDRVARASEGVGEAETTMAAKVRAALGVPD
jgi:hypothetical protein